MAPSSFQFPQPGGLLKVAGVPLVLGKCRRPRSQHSLPLQLRSPRKALATGGGLRS